MRPKILLLLAVLPFVACSPLRKTQSNRRADSIAIDRTEIRKAVHDILRESGTLTQTVVEFYPPLVAPKLEVVLDTTKTTPPESTLLPAESPKPPRPTVKRIVHTEIAAERERETTTDSTANNDLHTTLHTRFSDKVAEKPPAAIATVKWMAIALAAIAAIVLLLKFPKIKLPRL